MISDYRRRLSGVHKWAGVILGGLLFAVFWMGTLSVFDREIDRWMMPATRLAAPQQLPSLDKLLPVITPMIPADARQWRIDLPTSRTPLVRFSSQKKSGGSVSHLLDARTFTALPDPGTLGASGFFFPFHYGLHLSWMEIGKWLVGIAGMAMLLLLVSGVIIHRKLLADFFTFRPHKRLARSSLDLHNLSGVIGLPFHFFITLSGLVIFFNMYFPLGYQGAFTPGAEGKTAFQAQAYGRYSRPKAGTPGTLSSLDAMVVEAEQQWKGGVPYFVRVWHPGDANSYVELRRSYANNVTMNLDQLYFDAATGKLLTSFQSGPAMNVQRFLSGLHFIQFEHWPLRWLYFILGLSGCLMIATGLIFWLETRHAGHRANRDKEGRLMQSLCIGSITGIIVATLVYLAANRLLPLSANFFGQSRAALEVLAFCLAWLACFNHAAWRGVLAWREQTWTIAGLALACVTLNVLTTDAYSATTNPSLWAVWGVDLLLVLLAMAAAWGARRLKHWQDVAELQAQAGA